MDINIFSSYSRRDFLKKSLLAAGVFGLGRFTSIPEAMAKTIESTSLLPAIDELTITCLMDLGYDDSLKNIEMEGCDINRPSAPRETITAQKRTMHLVSEYGLSLLIVSESNGKKQEVLYDFSLTGSALLSNIEFLKVDPANITSLILSHGHGDHFGGLKDFLSKYRPGLPEDLSLYVGHENAFGHRWEIKDENKKDQGKLEKPDIEKHDINIKVIEKPTVIENHILLSGEIPMTTSHEKSSNKAKIENNDKLMQDGFTEELALIYNLNKKGLIIITACGHRGLINTIKHAQEITGIKNIYAIIGGFHLAKSSLDDLRQSLEILKELQVERIIPMHCTGMQGINGLMNNLPQHTIYNTTGSRYKLA